MKTESNSITRYLHPSDIANQARMKRGPLERRAGHRMSIVLVEGFTDQQFYTLMLDTTKCIIVYSNGKDNAIDALQLLLNDRTPGVIAIVDDDFDRLEGRSRRNDFIVVSETHDLETLIIFSNALEKLISTLLLPEKREYISDFASNMRRKLVELASPLGYIRWLFIREGIQIDFSNIYYQGFIEQKGLTINFDSCIEEIVNRNGGCKLTKTEIAGMLAGHMKNKVDPRQLCQGHDLIKIMLIIIPQMLFTYAPSKRDEAMAYINSTTLKIPNEERLTEQLIMAYEQNTFKNTIIYSEIKEWEYKNSPYQIVFA